MAKRWRCLLIGCGGISRLWLAPLREFHHVDIVALVDLLEEKARARAEEFKLDVPVFTSLTDALAACDVDIVFDCTIPEAHYAITMEALAAGCHVMGEKPMADTMQQAREMVKAATQSGKTYAVMQNRRFDPNIQTIKNFLARGVLGDITTIHTDFFIGAHFGGFRDTMPHVLIKDMAIHTFDAARYLSQQNATSVYCHEWNPAGSWYQQDASAIAIFEMNGGAVFSYRGSWCAEGLKTPWESHWRIIGTNGSLTWDGATTLECEVVEKPGGFVYQYMTPELPGLVTSDSGGWHANAIKQFLSALRSDAEPETVCTDNIFSLEMVLGATKSAETKQRVALGA